MNSYKTLAIVAFVALAGVACAAAEEFTLHIKSVSDTGREPMVDQDFTVKSTDTIADLKTKVREATGIPQRKMILSCNSYGEDNSKTLAAAGCKAGQQLTMVYRSGSWVPERLYLSTLIRRQGEDQEIRYKTPEDTIASIRATIGEHLGVPAEQLVLSYGSQKLQDDSKTLRDCGIEDDSTISVDMRKGSDGSYPVFIRTYSIDKHPDVQMYVSVKASTTVGQFKDMIVEKSILKRDELDGMYCDGKLADESKTLGDYKCSVGKEVTVNFRTF